MFGSTRLFFDQRQRDIFADGKRLQQSAKLKVHAEAKPELIQFVVRHGRDFLSEYLDGTAGWPKRPDDMAEQRALPHPELPMMITVSPLFTVKLIPLRTVRFPNARTRSRTSMTGSLMLCVMAEAAARLVQHQRFSPGSLFRPREVPKGIRNGQNPIGLTERLLSRNRIDRAAR